MHLRLYCIACLSLVLMASGTLNNAWAEEEPGHHEEHEGHKHEAEPHADDHQTIGLKRCRVSWGMRVNMHADTVLHLPEPAARHTYEQTRAVAPNTTLPAEEPPEQASELEPADAAELEADETHHSPHIAFAPGIGMGINVCGAFIFYAEMGFGLHLVNDSVMPMPLPSVGIRLGRPAVRWGADLRMHHHQKRWTFELGTHAHIRLPRHVELALGGMAFATEEDEQVAYLAGPSLMFRAGAHLGKRGTHFDIHGGVALGWHVVAETAPDEHGSAAPEAFLLHIGADWGILGDNEDNH